MFKNEKIKQLEKERDNYENIYHSTLVQWTKTVDKLKDLERENAKLRAEIEDCEDVIFEQVTEITELKAKYTAEVQKNFELVQKIDMLEG